MKIKLSKEEKDKLIKDIQYFFKEERDEEIGMIAAMAVLDFFLENMAPLIYNKSLDDARKWFAKRLEDVELDYDILYKPKS